MRRGFVAACLVLVACEPAVTPEPTPPTTDGPWRSALYPDDWQPGDVDEVGRGLPDVSYAGYGQGAEPPEVAGPVADAMDFGADPSGAQDSGPAIQAAIDSLPDGGVVALPAGSLRVDDRLVVSTDGLVLRGAGRGETRLWFTRVDGMSDRGHLQLAGAVTRGPDVPLLADGEPEHREVVVVAGDLAVGDEVAVGWAITEAFRDEHGMTATWADADGVWKPFFRREIVAIDGDRVTLDAPLRYAARVRDGASLRREAGYLHGVGVEDLSVSTVVDWDAAWSTTRTHAIRLQDVADGWVRRVDSFESPGSSDERGRHLLSGGIAVVGSKRVTVAEAELGPAQNRGGGGAGYLFEISRSSEILVRDSVGQGGRHNFIQNWDFGTSGCVFLRTTSRDGFLGLGDGDGLAGVGFSEFHHRLAMANLIDDSRVDDGWQAVNRKAFSSGAGHSATGNVFWNLRGDGAIRSFQHGWGYVIGTAGPTASVDLSEGGLFGDADGTEPVDWLEGADAGERLEPRSLYEDQRARRLAR